MFLPFSLFNTPPIDVVTFGDFFLEQHEPLSIQITAALYNAAVI
jgi:hypothetical protein